VGRTRVFLKDIIKGHRIFKLP